MAMNREKHLHRVEEFLECLRSKQIDYTVNLNDEPDEGYTDYEVRLTNNDGQKQTCVVLRSDGETVQMLFGEEFSEIDETDFFAYLFIWEFNTLEVH